MAVTGVITVARAGRAKERESAPEQNQTAIAEFNRINLVFEFTPPDADEQHAFAVAYVYAESLLGEELLERPTLAIEDDEVRVTLSATGGEDVECCRCSVGEEALGHSAHLLLRHGEDSIGRGEPTNGLMDEIRRQSHELSSPHDCEPNGRPR